jgi:hypothetical protein
MGNLVEGRRSAHDAGSSDIGAATTLPPVRAEMKRLLLHRRLLVD